MANNSDLQAVLTIEGDQLRVDLLTDPPQSGLFSQLHVQTMLDGRSNMCYSPAMRLLKQEWEDKVTIAVHKFKATCSSDSKFWKRTTAFVRASDR